MAKITKSKRNNPNERETIVVKTNKTANNEPSGFNWWKAASKAQRCRELLETVAFLKEKQQRTQRQASIFARMYGNMPLANWAGTAMSKMGSGPDQLPMNRPTMNVVQSCVDTLVSRICQSKPKPMFLTDGGDYKARSLSKQMNTFIGGELYQTHAYDIGELVLRDAAILGTGCIKIYEEDKKVKLDRVLCTEILVDDNDGFYGSPRSLYHIKLVDRDVIKDMLPQDKSTISSAEQAYPDNSGDSQKTMSNQIMLVEAWHLPSGPDASDGKHMLVCSAGDLVDEEYTENYFPFEFLPYSPRLTGFLAQGLAEQLTGTQVEINKLLITISQSISLVGVPRVFVEDGSKVVKSHLNDKIGAIVTYRGTKPEYEVAPCVPQELYAQLQRLIDYAYQQSGISALAATSQKPAGLNSGEAIRNYDDLQSDRFATLNKRYDNMYIGLVQKIIDKARAIALRDGKYQTVYPNKDGTKQIDLPEAKKLDDPFVIQCFDSNALPKDPAGRKQAIVEDIQSQILTVQEGRRLLNYSDLEQDDKLAVAAEERILKDLDALVEDGKYTPPDPFTDLQMARTKVVQYYNLYVAHGLEESRAQMLRNYKDQVDMLLAAAQSPAPSAPMPGAPGPQGLQQAVPQPKPIADLMPVAS